MAAPAAKLLTPSATEPATPLESALQDRTRVTEALADMNRAAARLHEAATAEASVIAEITALGTAESAEMTKMGPWWLPRCRAALRSKQADRAGPKA
jgi:hypothetical protein